LREPKGCGLAKIQKSDEKNAALPDNSSVVRPMRGGVRASLPEYWIVNLVNRTVEVHRAPNAGQYEQVSVSAKGARIGLVAFPDVELNVDDFVR
jgi:Uma2 family endonuclease